jgi:hypothetical protein
MRCAIPPYCATVLQWSHARYRRKAGEWHPIFHIIAAIAFPLIYSVYLGVAERARHRHRPCQAQDAQQARRRACRAGGAGFYRSAGLERRFRDIQAACYHLLQSGPQAEYAGAMVLGLPVDRIFRLTGLAGCVHLRAAFVCARRGDGQQSARGSDR